MDLHTTVRYMIMLGIGTLFSFFLFVITSAMLFAWIDGVLFAVIIILCFVFLRCPYCSGNLMGKVWCEYCPHCGKELDW